MKKLSQNGEMPGAGCDEKSDVESARATVSRQKSEKQRRAPSVPQNSVGSGVERLGALGRWHGGRGGRASSSSRKRQVGA